MEKIDWNHWFRHRTLHDWEIVALSLGINPMDIDVNSIDGINYIFDEIIPKHRVGYESRMRLLQDFRFKSYGYFEGDGDASNYFDASDSRFKKVLVKRFLLWLKNEDTGWELPKELRDYIEKIKSLKKAIKVLPGKNIPIQVQQDKNVLDAIKNLGKKPMALPPQVKSGTRTFKADVREYCIDNLGFTADSFDNTWKRLKANNKIKSG